METDVNNIIRNRRQRTTVKLTNIKRNLTSEKVYKILENIFSNRRTYNAIYTLRKENHMKNEGICYINFVNEKYISDLLEKISVFSGKKSNREIQAEFADIQGDEFISIIGDQRKVQISLDFIVFSDY